MTTILHIIRSYSRNSSLFNDIVAATADGHFRNIVCYLSGEDDGNNRMTEAADQVIYLNLKKSKVTWRSPGTVRLVRDIIDSENVDLLDCHMWRAIPIGALAAFGAKHRVKSVAVFHGVKARLSLRMKLLYFFVLRRMDRIVSVSEGGIADIRSLFWGVKPDKLRAIPNGLDFSAFEQGEAVDRAEVFGEGMANRRLFITVSRLAAKKNLGRLILAVAQVRPSHPDIGLVIVGDGVLRRELEARVSECGLEDTIIFLGYRQDIPSLLKSADIYAIPSLREGLPRSLVEAMSVGKPVLASRINGQEEVVTDQVHGRLVDPYSIDDMAGGLSYFMGLDGEALRTMGEAAEAHVRADFNRDVMKAKYRLLFEEFAPRAAAQKLYPNNCTSSANTSPTSLSDSES
jgi:glycosyltransferase involved in cell wall biosynthesis